MKQEDKNLLLKDLCGRIMHGVKCATYEDTIIHTLSGVIPDRVYNELYFEELDWKECNGFADIQYCKPYLFPLSSMTEEQKKELLELTGYEARCEEDCGFDSWGFYVNIVGEYKYEDGEESILLYPDDIGIDWLNKNHFDYRGLIEKDLAIDATGLNVY